MEYLNGSDQHQHTLGARGDPCLLYVVIFAFGRQGSINMVLFSLCLATELKMQIEEWLETRRNKYLRGTDE